ncbi:MAG: chlorosome envelope protein H [Chlorobiaceae bacterium]|jgi:chlorosome envelope protein H|nr:chlorosome envelope protein H [Chlorobiaceae bacterium]
MAAEELNKPAGAPKKATPITPETNVGNGDMANLIGNVGILIDSTIESVQGIISSVSSATGQLIEGVTSTINSEPVKGIINNVNSVSGQLIEGVTSTTGHLIEGVTATINSEQVQSSFLELGKLWKNLLENLNSTVSSGQVQNLFNNISSGLGQLVNNIVSPGIQTGQDRHRKEITQIPFCQKEVVREIKTQAPDLKPNN